MGGQGLQRLGDLDEAGDPGGIVVGAVVHEAEGAVAVAGIAVAHMVVVGAHDDQLVGHRRIAPAGEGEDIPHAAKRLIETARVTGRFEAEMIDRFDDVGPGRPATATPRFAAFEGVVGEGGDMAAGITGDDRGRGGGQPGGSGQFR